MNLADIVPGVLAKSHAPIKDRPKAPGVELDRSKLSIRLKISPSNLVTFSAVTPRPVKKEARELDVEWQSTEVLSDVVERLAIADSIARSAPELFDGPILSAPPENGPPLVNRAKLHRDLLSHKKFGRIGYGGLSKSKGVSRKTRRKISDTVAAIEKEYGKENTRFVTLTLPASTPEAFETFARWSAWIVDILNKRLTRFLGADHARVWIWEYQKRGALHSHLYIGKSKGIDSLDDLIFRSWWVDILGNLSDKTGVDLFRKNESHTWRDDPSKVRVEVAKVRKSVSAYLAKYMSKSESKIGGEHNHFFPPSRWFLPNPAATKLRQKHTYSEIVGYATGEQWEQIKPEIIEMVTPFIAQGTKILDTAIKGRINDCIYAIHGGTKDCMDAIKGIGQLITSAVRKVRHKFTFLTDEQMIDIYEKQARKEIAILKKQQKHDNEVAHIAVHGRRRFEKPRARPTGNYWNSVGSNGKVMYLEHYPVDPVTGEISFSDRPPCPERVSERPYAVSQA